MSPTFDEVMTITRGISQPLSLDDDEARALYDCASQVPNGGLLVEIGCQLGRSSSIFAQLQQAIGFHSVHIDPFTSQMDHLKAWAEMMHRVGGDFTHEFTLLCMRTEQAEWHLGKLGPIDMAYIDGDHEQCGVEIDLRLVADKIRRGGYLACHDYARDWLIGVQRAINPYIAATDNWEPVGVFGCLGVWRRK